VHCCDTTASSLVAIVQGKVFSHFHAVAVAELTVWPVRIILCEHPLDVKANDEHALDFTLHLSRLFGLGEFGLLHWEDCCFV
jgi:hypothetical protein